MIFPCDSASPCLDNGPFANLSAELPDADLFGSYQFGPLLFPPLGGTFKNPIPTPCFAQAATQDLADAAAQNCVINNIPPPGPPGTPTPPIIGAWRHSDGSAVHTFGNQEVTCAYTCPDGLEFVWTVGPNYFYALDQNTANLMAKSFACRMAYNKHICLSSPATSFCVGIANAVIPIVAVGGKAPFTFQVVGGSLPPGMSLQQFNANTVLVVGTPTVAGNYPFTIAATDANGNFMVKHYTAYILGIANLDALPAAVQGAAYSFQLQGAGGTAPYTFAIAMGSLPAGITMTTAGLISGTPTGTGASTFTVEVTDSSV